MAFIDLVGIDDPQPPVKTLTTNSIIECIVDVINDGGSATMIPHLGHLIIPYCLDRVRGPASRAHARRAVMSKAQARKKRTGKASLATAVDTHKTKYFTTLLSFARESPVDDALFDLASFECEACRVKIAYQLLLKFIEDGENRIERSEMVSE